MDDQQTPEELEAHYGPDGPVQVVRDWIAAVFVEADLEEAWQGMEYELRLVFAQLWLWENRDRLRLSPEDLVQAVESLTAADTEHVLWARFSAAQLEHFGVMELGEGTWGALSRPRPVAVDYELVKIVRGDEVGEGVYAEPTLVEGHVFLMHHEDDRWLIAALGETAPRPGWPPRLGP